MPVAGEIVLFAGAPKAAELDYEDPEALLSSFDASFQRFLNGRDAGPPVTSPPSTALPPRWRHLGLQSEKPSAQSRRATIEGRLRRHGDVTTDMEFLEHSIASIDSFVDIEPVPYEGAGLDCPCPSAASFSVDTSLETASDLSFDGVLDLQTSSGKGMSLIHDMCVTDLRDVPSAAHLHRITPQTMSVNLMAAIIKIEPLRVVNIRARNCEMEIVEVIVGDETLAGFSVTFWLTPTPIKQSGTRDRNSVLRAQLRALRSGDIIGVRHVALAAFRDKVGGQSLSKKAANVYTTLVVLNDDVDLSRTLHEKYQRVTAWANNFVGTNDRLSRVRPKNSCKRKHDEDELPPDTQPDG